MMQESARPTVWPLYVVTFLATYTIAVAAISAPGIQHGLQISESGTSLVVGAYSATFAAGLIFFGRLGDRWGRRRMFRVGTLALAITALLTASAPTVEFLVAARLVQGCAAAVTTPQVLASIQSILQGSARLRAVGLYSVFAGSGTVSGQVIGGLVNSAFGPDLGWRAAFATVGVLAVIAWVGARHLTETRSPRPLGLDARGSVLVALALLFLIAGLTNVAAIDLLAPLSPPGPLLWTAALLGASAACFGLLALHARLRERTQRPSILPLEVMREPAVRTGMALACLLFMMIGGFAYNYAILSQQGYGLAPWESGLATATLALAFVIASALAPRIVVRLGGTVHGGRRTLLMASVIQGVGLVGLGIVAIVGVDHFFVWYQFAGVLIGGGQGLMMGPLVSVVMAAVPDEAAGLTGGLVATAQQTGIGLGIAVLSTIFAGLTQLLPMTTAYGWTTLATVLLTVLFALFAARIVEQAEG